MANLDSRKNRKFPIHTAHPPVGLILCADRADALGEYTTTGLANEIFVSKYLVELPEKEALLRFLRAELA
jgi:hypothetical protein